MNVMAVCGMAARVAGMGQISYVKKVKGKGYCVKSEKSPEWSGGCFETKGEAQSRLDQVEMFKHMKGKGKKKGKKRKSFLQMAARIAATGPFATVTLQKTVGPDRLDHIKQWWRIDVEGKSVVIQSFTSSGGHVEIVSKNDFEIPVGNQSVKASDIIRHILTDVTAYPNSGESVLVDEAFVNEVIQEKWFSPEGFTG